MGVTALFALFLRTVRTFAVGLISSGNYADKIGRVMPSRADLVLRLFCTLAAAVLFVVLIDKIDYIYTYLADLTNNIVSEIVAVVDHYLIILILVPVKVNKSVEDFNESKVLVVVVVDKLDKDIAVLYRVPNNALHLKGRGKLIGVSAIYCYDTVKIAEDVIKLALDSAADGSKSALLSNLSPYCAAYYRQKKKRKVGGLYGRLSLCNRDA